MPILSTHVPVPWSGNPGTAVPGHSAWLRRVPSASRFWQSTPGARIDRQLTVMIQRIRCDAKYHDVADAARTRRQISGPGMSVSGISSMGNANRSLSTIPMVITIPLCPARPHRPSSNGRHGMHLMCFGRHCVPMCAPKRRPRALKNANRAICVAMCAHLSFRRAHRNAKQQFGNPHG